MDNTEILYRLNADYKNTTYQQEYWSNYLSNGKQVILLVTTYFRGGTFKIRLDNAEKKEILKKNEISLNDYNITCEELLEKCAHWEEIQNESSYNKEELREIYCLRLICCNIKNGEEYNGENERSLGEELLEENKWSLENTIYGIDTGCILAKIQNNDDDTNDDELSIDSGQFKCQRCEHTEDKNNCYKCDDDDICSSCYGNGGDYGPLEEWVCEYCLPACLTCGGSIRHSQDECCGNGRSDIPNHCIDSRKQKRKVFTYM